MEVGGLTPFTLTDFPGEVACIVFTQGCNLSCPFCHNKALIPIVSTGNSFKGVRPFIEKRRGILSGVVISGGEPTIQEDLEESIAQIKEMGFKVKLDTNGTNPQVIEKLLKRGLIDLVAMDIKAPWGKYHLLCGLKVDTGRIKDSLAIIAESGTPHYFRTTLVPGLLDQADVGAIRGLLPPGAPHVVQPFRSVADKGKEVLTIGNMGHLAKEER